jgi:uncharacterized damage-inducible protein DinB
MKLVEPIIAELGHEASSTRKMFERVPQDSFMWKPHDKSRTVGEIATHIANLPGIFIASLNQDEFDRSEYKSAAMGTVSSILITFDKNIVDGVDVLKVMSDERLLESWRYKYGEQTILEMPRLAVIRAMGINHLIHHRGQLSVYLRLLNVPLPPVYGQTADEK